jgi:hypothetical protein
VRGGTAVLGRIGVSAGPVGRKPRVDGTGGTGGTGGIDGRAAKPPRGGVGAAAMGGRCAPAPGTDEPMRGVNMTGRASGVARGPPGAVDGLDGFGGAPGRCGGAGGTDGVERGIVGTDGCAPGGCGTTRPPTAGVGHAFGGSDDDDTTGAEPIGVDRGPAPIGGAEIGGADAAGVATAIGLALRVS